MAIRVERGVPVTLRDGTVLRADVYRPDAEGTYPGPGGAVAVRAMFVRHAPSDTYQEFDELRRRWLDAPRPSHLVLPVRGAW